MRIAFLLLLSAFSCLAQLPVVPLQINSAGFTPATVTHTALFLNYLDLPLSGKPTTWTDEVSHVIFTNQGSTLPTNSPSGMYFDGTAGNFFKNSNSGVRMSNVVDSVWFCLTIISFNHTLDMVVADDNVAGHGFNVSSAATGGGNGIEYVGSAANPISKAVTNVQYDVASVAHNDTQIRGFTNGVASLIFTTVPATPCNIWGIGQDADSDNNAHMYLKFVLIATNYIFTAQDIANLHTYAITH